MDDQWDLNKLLSEKDRKDIQEIRIKDPDSPVAKWNLQQWHRRLCCSIGIHAWSDSRSIMQGIFGTRDPGDPIVGYAVVMRVCIVCHTPSCWLKKIPKELIPHRMDMRGDD